jgi:hypothetical protein
MFLCSENISAGCYPYELCGLKAWIRLLSGYFLITTSEDLLVFGDTLFWGLGGKLANPAALKWTTLEEETDNTFALSLLYKIKLFGFLSNFCDVAGVMKFLVLLAKGWSC